MSKSLSDSKLNNIKETQERTLKNILELQQLEKQLYTNLEASSSKGDVNGAVEQEQIIKRINDLSSTRINLFNTLKDMYEYTQSNVNDSRDELVNQMTNAKVMEQSLNNLKLNINAIEQEKNNKLRMVEINTYYGQRYQAHSDVMKSIVICCIPIIILSVLSKNGLLPSSIANGLMSFIVVIGMFVILRKMWDLSYRNNMSYQEYDFNDDIEANNPTVIEYDKEQFGYAAENVEDAVAGVSGNITNMIGDCINGNCCANGTVFDSSSNQCIVASNDSSTNDTTSPEAFSNLRNFASF